MHGAAVRGRRAKHQGPKLLMKFTPNLKRHAPPYAYMLPKDKDPRAKSRPIVSYFNHPNKALLKVAAQAFMWVLKQVENKKLAKSFVQFDTRDFATSAPDSIKKLCSEYPNEDLKAYLGDIKNMYTNIPHPALMEAIQWAVDLVRDLPDAKLGISVKKVRHGKSGICSMSTFSACSSL